MIDYAYFDSAKDVLIQPDGKIVVAGEGGSPERTSPSHA